MYWKAQWLLPLLAGQLVMLGAAQTASPPTKVGIISTRDAILSTADGKTAVKDIETRFDPKRKEIEKRQQDLQEKQNQLKRGESVLSDDQKRNLAAEIDQMTKSLQRYVEDANAELEQAQNKVFQELGQKMMVIVDRYAKEKGYSVIIDVSSPQTPVLYAANEVNLTDEIVQEYDKAHGGADTPANPAATKPAPPAAKQP